MPYAPREGNAALRLTAPNGTKFTHLLNRPLHFRAAPARRTTRYTRDSLDLSAREVIAIGAGRAELETDIRLERAAQDLIDILSYAADGSVITYYPDLDIGTGFDLSLVDEGDVIGLGLEDGRGAFQEYERTVRFRDASASGQSLESLFSPWLFRYDASFASRLVTFTRSGAVGPYIDGDGLLKQAAANIPRTTWFDLDNDGVFETPGLLLEAARTNLVSSDNFDAGWTSFGTPVVTSAISDPAGGTAAYRIEDNDGAASEGKQLDIAFTGNAQKIVVFVVRQATMASSGNQSLELRDSTAGLDRLALEISAWSNGEPTVAATTGTYVGKYRMRGGYWALIGLTTTVTAANTNRAQIRPCLTASATGSIDVYRVNAFNSDQPGLSVLNASAVRSDEAWYAAFSHTPQAMTVYVKFIEGQTQNWPDQGYVFDITSAGNGAPRLEVYRETGAGYAVQHYDGVTSRQSFVSASAVFGQTIELRVELRADGSVLLGRSTNGGAEVLGSASGTLAFQPAWAAPRLYLGSAGAVSPGHQAFLSCKVVAGVKTLAEMRAL